MGKAQLDDRCGYQTFLEDHLLPNVPCIFPSSLVGDWPCFRTFVVRDARSPDATELNFGHLLELHGGGVSAPSTADGRCAAPAPAPVHRPSTAEEVADGCPPTVCDDRSVDEVFALWREGGGEGLYVKDWHLALAAEKAGRAPFYDDRWAGMVADDWLNGFYRSRGEDFRFVYLGAAGTTTLLHRDVYASNSISTNVAGRKRWHLFPPATVHNLHRDPADLRSELVPDVRAVDRARFAGWERARAECVVVEQEAGETIFVPSGWYHQVENLASPTSSTDRPTVLSINHNWANSTTVLRMFATLAHDVDACARSIDDVREMLQRARDGRGWEREWAQEVQDLVKRDAGWNWLDFWQFVRWGVQNSYRDDMAGLQPPRAYIDGQVALALARMETKRAGDLAWLDEVRAIMREVRELLDGGAADAT